MVTMATISNRNSHERKSEWNKTLSKHFLTAFLITKKMKDMKYKPTSNIVAYCPV